MEIVSFSHGMWAVLTGIENNKIKRMKIIIGALAFMFLTLLFFFKENKETQVKIYNRNGIISREIRLWLDTITVSSSNAFSVDISSAGFSGVMAVYASAIKNTSSVSSVPFCQVKTIGTSSIVVNLIEQNSSTVNILGSLVLLGVPLQFVSNTSGLQIAVAVLGY